jgi:hypothetical protein
MAMTGIVTASLPLEVRAVRRHDRFYLGLIEENSIPEPNSGCWLWLGALNSDGYGAIRVNGRQWHAHRLAYVLVNGEPPNDTPVIRHLCNNPACANPDHLAAGTTQDNAADRVAAGTHVAGSKHPLAKLSEDDIPTIVAAHNGGASIRGLAKSYRVSQRTIQFVLRGITWKRVSGL